MCGWILQPAFSNRSYNIPEATKVKLAKVGIGTIFVLAGALANAQQTIIDDLGVTLGSKEDSGFIRNSSLVTPANYAQISNLGGGTTRLSAFTVNSPDTSNGSRLNVDNGFLTFSNEASASSGLTLRYEGLGAFIQNNPIFEITFADNSAPLDLRLGIADFGSNVLLASTAQSINGSPVPAVYRFDLSSDPNFAGAISSNSSLILDFSNLAHGSSFTVCRITGEPVPEPATIAALGLGAVALLRKRKK